jgi:PilZ domain
MWETLKKIFQAPSGPPAIIEPISFTDGLLCFKTDAALKLKKTKVAAPSKLGYIEVELEILSFDEATSLYRAKVKDETFALDAMQMGRRREFRLDVKLPVTLMELKGKAASTEDISLNGARLLVPREFERGEHIGIKVHFKNANIPDLGQRCEVQWCAPTRKGQFHCGVRFFMINKAEKSTIKRFIQNYVAMGGK